jgi:hypothetical protein
MTSVDADLRTGRRSESIIYPTVTSARSCNKVDHLFWNTIDGNIFNKHNDQEKKDISKKDLFHLHGIYSIQTSLF